MVRYNANPVIRSGRVSRSLQVNAKPLGVMRGLPVVRVRATAVILLGCSLLAPAYPYPKSHGPFASGEAPPRFPLRRCVLLNSAQVEETEGRCTRVFAAATTRPARYLHLEPREEPSGYFARVLDGDRRVVMESRPVSGFQSMVLVSTADLNGDHVEDFVISAWSSGCGLAACYYHRAFVLSDGRGYKVSVVPTLCPGPEDIVRLKGRKRCYVITTRMIGNGDEKTRDGRRHNFWVYDLLRVQAAHLRIANTDDSRFPKWVWYTFKDNHSETMQLTTRQKRRLWSQTVEDLSWKSPDKTATTHPRTNAGGVRDAPEDAARKRP